MVERLTAEREVGGSIPGTGPTLRILGNVKIVSPISTFMLNTLTLSKVHFLSASYLKLVILQKVPKIKQLINKQTKISAPVIPLANAPIGV